MKIHTDAISFEMSIEEFEAILKKDMLDMMVSVVAALSEQVAEGADFDDIEEVMSLLNELCMEENMRDLYDFDDYDSDLNLNDEDSEEGPNETIDRIYRIIFGNGDKHRG
jgi:hypothetical protein